MDETLEPQPTQQVKISQEVRNYLPTILGAIVVLAAVIGGWYLWQGRQEAQVSAPAEETSQVAPSPSPLPVSETQATELPAAGFPAPVLAAASALLLAAGWKLRKRFS